MAYPPRVAGGAAVPRSDTEIEAWAEETSPASTTPIRRDRNFMVLSSFNESAN
jgi:hypothetical protein